MTTIVGQAAPDRPGARTRLRLLGAFELQTDGAGPLRCVPGDVQRMLAYLALSDRPSRSCLAGQLWMDSDEERAAASLRTAVWRTRRLAPDILATDGGGLRLAAGVEVDVATAVDRARRITQDVDPFVDGTIGPEAFHLEQLLPAWDEEWLVFERERIRQIQLHAIEAACRNLSASGLHDLAVQAGLAAVQADPLRESAHRALIAAHLAEGNRIEALRQYDACADRLRRELDVDPSPATRSLVAPAR